MDLATPPNPRAPRIGADQELAILTEIGRILSATLDLRESFQKMMQIISEKLDMRRGALVLLDESTGRLRTEAAVGLTPEEIERGKYALGEGITGNVVATGRAIALGVGAISACGLSVANPRSSTTTAASERMTTPCRRSAVKPMKLA